MIEFTRLRVVGKFAALLVLTPALTLAEPTPSEKAAAEALFQEATRSIEQSRYSEACEQFEASQKLDPAVGTLLRLADCYDRLGRTASAWALFSEAASRARASEQFERAQIAGQRAAELERRLSKLQIEPNPADVRADLQIKLNGFVLSRAVWDVPVPVDPGVQRIEVSGRGRAPWSTTLTVSQGPTEQRFQLPALARHMSPAVNRPQKSSAPRKFSAASSTGPAVWLGYAAGGLGVIALGAGGIFGYRAYDLNQQSLDECSSQNANACTPSGKNLRDDARSAAGRATFVTIAGGALLATGVTLVLTAQPASRSKTGARTLRLQSAASGSGAELSLQGEWL